MPKTRLSVRPLVRVLSILRTLEDGGRHRIFDLACEHDVHVRTIRRDIYALEEAGFPIGHEVGYDQDGSGYWWLITPQNRPSQNDPRLALSPNRQRSATSDDLDF